MPDFDRLSAQIVSRRVALGFRNRQALADAAGISVRTIGDLETGRGTGNFHAATIAALEHALGWGTGSVAQILDGYEPVLHSEAPEVSADAAIEVVMRSDLPDDVKRRFANILVEDRIAADNRRIDLARALIEAAA